MISRLTLGLDLGSSSIVPLAILCMLEDRLHRFKSRLQGL